VLGEPGCFVMTWLATSGRSFLAERHTVPQATRQILGKWREAVEDEEDGPVIWLAPALLQWDCGALQPRVTARAIRVIDRGDDLQRWQSEGNSSQVRQRKAMLVRLRDNGPTSWENGALQLAQLNWYIIDSLMPKSA